MSSNNTPKILALIPARGGSKGVLRKNIKQLNHHPLIAYSIHSALESSCINRVIVSTDDDEIRSIAKNYKAEVPFLRPSKLAQDHSLDFDVFHHTLTWLKENEQYTPDLVVHLRPTCPFRETEIIDNAIQHLLNCPEYDSLRSVSPSPKTPYKMWFIQNKSLSPIITDQRFDESYNQPRQLLPETYWQNGYIDITKATTILKLKTMCGKKICPFIINHTVTDIDTEEDFLTAEKIYFNNQKNSINLTHPK